MHNSKGRQPDGTASFATLTFNTPEATSQPSPGHGQQARHPLPSASPGYSDSASQALLPPTSFRPPPPPPPLPHPWTWRCHNCNTLARLACTRRCLRCGHQLCTRPGRRRGRVCRIEFDYQRWRAWAAWREDVERGPSRLPASEGRHGRRRRGRRRDCWRECHYPSECHHSRATRREELMVQSGSGSEPGSVAGGRLDHDGSSSVTAADGGLEPWQTIDPAMLEASLVRVVAGRPVRDDGWTCGD
ncbi:hypothetical protein LX36DRAFT_458147 [Colletotrichum falcatum]|nr:hypothetical protein LX36DRAFT_458147 [Colletotrichum falcatum]